MQQMCVVLYFQKFHKTSQKTYFNHLQRNLVAIFRRYFSKNTDKVSKILLVILVCMWVSRNVYQFSTTLETQQLAMVQ